MTSSTWHRKVQTDNTMKAYRKQRQYIYHHSPSQLCHVTTSYALMVGVCILMLPMLELASEHVQLTTKYCTNPCHVTFSHIHLLPLVDHVLPAMVLQNRAAWSNFKCSSHCRVCHVSLSPTIFTGLTGVMRFVVVLLLLLMSGDIETNPGPVGECTYQYRCQVQVY